MFRIAIERMRQRHRTINFPAEAPALPDRFFGRPAIDAAKCPEDCSECIRACPVSCISRNPGGVELDMGKCIFCGKCAEVCPDGALSFTRDHRISETSRSGLQVGGETPCSDAGDRRLEEIRACFGRSLKLRQVSAGGCNACEADINVLNTLVWDLGKFGIQTVASPRHADGIVVTGPVTENMKLALLKTYDAVSDPKVVIAVGACAISGGVYRENQECRHGLEGILPVDLYIPGCPPHPSTILHGLLSLLGKA